jgi:hypothetical protein
MKRYKVIHQYESAAFDTPILLPVGTIGEWNDALRRYVFQVGDVAVPVRRWMVENLTAFFEEVR